MAQYINKAAVKAEIANLQATTVDEDGNFYTAKAQAEFNVLCMLDSFLNTLEVKEVEVETKIDTLISDSRKANRAKFIKELKQKIDSYERELSKSGDYTKCDDVDWVALASDMFDMLQKCLMNY